MRVVLLQVAETERYKDEYSEHDDEYVDPPRLEPVEVRIADVQVFDKVAHPRSLIRGT